MPGFEVFGEEEKREVMQVLESGVLFRYGFEEQRGEQWKVRQFEEAFARLFRAIKLAGVAHNVHNRDRGRQGCTFEHQNNFIGIRR